MSNNFFADPIFRILLKCGFKIISVFPHPEISIHYIFDDIRNDSDETVISSAVSITEFLSINRGQTEEGSVVALLTNWIERNNAVIIRLHKIPYITHAII